MRRWTDGQFVFTIKELHDKYGPVVRIAANQLSFSTATSWKEIYGHTPGRRAFLKGAFYEPMPGEVRNLLSESDPASHSLMRRNLSHGFSATALKSQEDLIQKFVDLFIDQINGRKTGGEELRSVDVVKWFNFLTFDIIGELAFGDTFGSLKEGKVCNRAANEEMQCIDTVHRKAAFLDRNCLWRNESYHLPEVFRILSSPTQLVAQVLQIQYPAVSSE